MESQTAVELLGALAHDTRIELFRELVAAGPEGLAAGELADRLDVPAPTLSFHLKELRRVGAIGCRAEGRSRIYTPDFAVMRGLVGFLTENCCSGRRVRRKRAS
ncbi:MAG: metalloregulator ArsR/SmtB family transcription factor [Myxococcota bacterium]|nr:metalloregulator ArsR/SmtB family transcription factor [Myxococcota bacterium]